MAIVAGRSGGSDPSTLLGVVPSVSRDERTRPTGRPGAAGRPGPFGPGAYEIDPTSGGTRANFRSVRYSTISTSGFGPASRRRNNFSMRRLPKRTEVLLWSGAL